MRVNLGSFIILEWVITYKAIKATSQGEVECIQNE